MTKAIKLSTVVTKTTIRTDSTC